MLLPWGLLMMMTMIVSGNHPHSLVMAFSTAEVGNRRRGEPFGVMRLRDPYQGIASTMATTQVRFCCLIVWRRKMFVSGDHKL